MSLIALKNLILRYGLSRKVAARTCGIFLYSTVHWHLYSWLNEFFSALELPKHSIRIKIKLTKLNFPTRPEIFQITNVNFPAAAEKRFKMKSQTREKYILRHLAAKTHHKTESLLPRNLVGVPWKSSGHNNEKHKITLQHKNNYNIDKNKFQH